MNFKPTASKVIGSIAFTIILFWIPLFFIKEGSKVLDLVNLSDPLSTTNIIIFVIEVVVLYLLFSLFHKSPKKMIIMKEDTFKKMMQAGQVPPTK